MILVCPLLNRLIPCTGDVLKNTHKILSACSCRVQRVYLCQRHPPKNLSHPHDLSYLRKGSYFHHNEKDSRVRPLPFLVMSIPHDLMLADAGIVVL